VHPLRAQPHETRNLQAKGDRHEKSQVSAAAHAQMEIFPEVYGLWKLHFQ
jgi:hypothetical protein